MFQPISARMLHVIYKRLAFPAIREYGTYNGMNSIANQRMTFQGGIQDPMTRAFMCK